jgi:hypothetical protein
MCDERRPGLRQLGRLPGDADRRVGGRTTVLRRAVLIALLSLPALADEKAAESAQKPGVKVIREPDKVVIRKRTVIDFNDVTVEGELVKPEGSYVLDRSRTRFPSLIRLRDDFNPELQKSADNL